MSIEIENIFKAKAKSSWSFLIENGQGCYIPAYQRPYSWDTDNAIRLFEDAIHGLDMLLVRSDSVTFLGTLITINDTQYKTVQPIFKEEVASKVMTVIDGQQRISTFIMINIIFHDTIRRLAKRFKNKNEEHFSWLVEQAERWLPDLQDTFVLDMRTGEGNYKFYPRIIRAYDDVWSRRKGQARYTSPIANLIWCYYNHSVADENKAYNHAPKDGEGEPDQQHSAVVDIFKFLKRRIPKIVNGTDNDIEFPDLFKILQNENFIESIWGHELPEGVIDYIQNSQDEKSYIQFVELVKYIILSRYMSHRMAFTIVTTRSEDDAFDMFEALNTTGEPLTAYETFKPEVIKAETLEEFEHSDSKVALDSIEQYLDRFAKAEQKQRATSELLVPFALSETGFKLPKRLNDQRRYLRDQYKLLDKLDEKRTFVKRLSSMTVFINNAWECDTVSDICLAPVKAGGKTTTFALAALRKINHSVTIAPIARFFHEAIKAKDTEGETKKASDLEEAIKASAAFSMIWRGAFGSTNNIDGVYREIVRSGIPKNKVQPLAKRPENGTGVVSLNNYKKAFRIYLEDNKISTKADWAKRVKETPIYLRNKDIARFLLFCASEDAIADKETSGLIKKGRPGVNPMLDISTWSEDDYFSVEHIIPKNQTPDWHSSINDDPDVVHSVGNLILLPQDINSYLGNRDWTQKQAVYKLLASADTSEFKELVKTMEKAGFNLGKRGEEILTNSRYLAMCSSVSEYDGAWDVNFIHKRSERIANLAWDILWPWLEATE